MAGVKLVVMYPRSKDVAVFEKSIRTSMYRWPSLNWAARPSLWRLGQPRDIANVVSFLADMKPRGLPAS